MPIWKAWCYLSRSRSIGFSEGPVPLSEIEAFLRLRYPEYGIDERMWFVDWIVQLDGIHFKVREQLAPTTES